MIPTYGWHDSEDRFLAPDKVEHLLGGALVGALAMSVSMPLGIALLVTLGFGASVEAWEVVRWLDWQERKAPQPWPWMCDKWSWKDIIVDLLGGYLGWRAAYFLGGL